MFVFTKKEQEEYVVQYMLKTIYRFNIELFHISQPSKINYKIMDTIFEMHEHDKLEKYKT